MQIPPISLSWWKRLKENAGGTHVLPVLSSFSSTSETGMQSLQPTFLHWSSSPSPLPLHHLLPSSGSFCSSFFHLKTTKIDMATYSNILAWGIPMDRGAWWAAVLGSQRVGTTKHSNRTQNAWDRWPLDSTLVWWGCSCLERNVTCETALQSASTKGSIHFPQTKTTFFTSLQGICFLIQLCSLPASHPCASLC